MFSIQTVGFENKMYEILSVQEDRGYGTINVLDYIKSMNKVVNKALSRLLINSRTGIKYLLYLF